MEVILLKDVKGLGQKGDVVTAKDGYARNYLIPRGLAAIATHSSVREAKHQQISQAKRDAQRLEAAQKRKEEMEQETFHLSVKAGEGGRIFGSVTNMNIAEAMQAAGYSVDKKDILLKAPIKEIGSHEVDVRLHPEVHATIKVEVSKE